MRIDNVDVVNLLYTIPAGQGFRSPGGVCTGRVSSVVRVWTDNGITGIGSVYSHPDLVRIIVEDQLRDMLIGGGPTGR